MTTLRKSITALTLLAAITLTPRHTTAQDASVNAAESVPLTRSKAETYAPGSGRTTGQTLRLEPGPHLFIDDLLIESSEHVDRITTVPQRDPAIPNPVVTGEQDGCFQPYMTVLRDLDTGRFRIWYGSHTDDRDSVRSRVAHMESDDGVHWNRPPRVLDDPGPIQFGVSIIDEGAGFPDPERRYKFGWYHDNGLQIAVSADGLSWTRITTAPAVRHNHDITGIFRDPLRNRYTATVSVYRTGEDWSGQRRITMQCHSQDLLKWSEPHYVVTPKDGPDPGETQFYAMDGYLVRGNLLLGMVKVLRDDLKADDPPDPPNAYGVGYTALAWSRDGETWVRDRDHFFDPNPKPGTWDHAHAWIDEQVLVGDETWLYYGGYARGHKVERFRERQIGLLKMKLDRYVARASTGEPGRLLTPPLILQGDALTLNADASGGTVKIQVLNPDGKPVPGFTLAESAPIHQNAVAIPAAWARPVSDLKEYPVRLEFHLENARLYGFTLQ